MIIAVASGKGGTGKTMTSVNLAFSFMKKQKKPVRFFDCDVEQPNAHIFFKPRISSENAVEMFMPEIDADKCSLCGKCSTMCQYNALFLINKEIMFFPEMCHSCYGCFHICPNRAVSKGKKKIGYLLKGQGFDMDFFYGVLDVGQAMAPPLIRKVKESVSSKDINIIDCPPGTSCPAVSAVGKSDFVVIVTEPTPFGLNDMKLLVETVKEMKIPFGVVINKCDMGDDCVRDYCKKEKISLLGEIPYRKDIAKICSDGKLLSHKKSEYQDVFYEIGRKIKGILR